MTTYNEYKYSQLSIKDWLNGPDSPDVFANHMSFAPAPEKQPIEDFGEKIGGSRKDLWGNNRVTYIGDCICKTDVVEKPDYKELYSSGRSRELVYFIKRVWEAIPAKPKITEFMADYAATEELERIQSMYARVVKTIMGRLYEMSDIRDIISLRDFLEDVHLILVLDHKYECLAGSEAFITSRLVNTLRMKPLQVTQEAERKQFLFTKEEKAASGRAAASRPAAKRKTAFKFPHLEHVIRIGGEDYRKGKDVTGDDYLNVFHFRGGEFGLWLPQEERQEVLNQGYDAFMDMADVLGITPQQLTGDGKLAIAFGARGRGRALAHFEPDLCVINITRMRGAGSLAHEMTHFLDYLIGRNLGFPGFLSNRFSDTPESFKELLNVMKGKAGDRTKFYNDAFLLDGRFSKSSKSYWSSDVELLARAGATYFKDRLAEKGIRNDYLCGHADTVAVNTTAGMIDGAPQSDERKLINQKFDEFFEDMKERQVL